MGNTELGAFLTVQCIMCIAALGHYLPLSMKQLDVGIAGYMAIGAYTSALLTRNHDVSFAVALLAGTGAAALAALIIDSLATRVRLSGFAYAIFSLSFAESLRVILNNADFAGATTGLAGIKPHTTLGLAATLLALTIAGFVILDRTRLGQLKTAICDDEFIVPQMGVPLLATKLTIFAIGGALGGLSGGLFAHYVIFIRPDDFGFALLIAIQLPIVFGGLDRFYGALVGTVLLATLPELVRGLGNYRLLFIGAATMLLLALRPAGLVSHDNIRWIAGRFDSVRALFGGRRRNEEAAR
ncbi:branched-chain amino acid ABC transporter permease [Ramlibacter sp.]|uniref:branched-chain amino acid ABC transporter permease n=1 Tax=Ramlibacter sp. TaxID=1917967 RepID=UPI003D11F2F5